MLIDIVLRVILPLCVLQKSMLYIVFINIVTQPRSCQLLGSCNRC
jgi:hypothetical protein